MLCLFISSAVGVVIYPEESLAARNWFTGLIVGLLIATLGYAKVEVPEDFDAVKFLVTVIIGGLSGFISATQGWSYLDAKTWLATTGISTWVEYFLKTIIRRLI